MAEELQYSVGNGISTALKNGTGLLLSRLAFIAMPFLFTAAVLLGKEVATLYLDKIVTVQAHQLELLKDLNSTVRDMGVRTTRLESYSAAHGASITGIKERLDDGRRHR